MMNNAWGLDHCPVCTKPLENKDQDFCNNCGWHLEERDK